MSQVVDKHCPICGRYTRFSSGAYVCISCPFKCFEDDFDRVCAAMNAYNSAKKLAEWVIANPRHTYNCLTHDMLGTGCICGYDDAEKLAKELLGEGR